MKTEYYKKLCKFCDKILLSKKSTIFTHSVTDLHVLKEHPILLVNYFKNIKYKNKDKNNLTYKLFQYLIELFFKNKNFKLNSFQKKGCDVIIISNLINDNHLKNQNDFYFGNIEKKLNDSGLKTFTVLRNFTDKSETELLNKLNKNKILLFKTTFFFKEIYFLYKALVEFIKININFDKPKIKYLSSNFLSLISFKSIISNLRLSYQINLLASITKSKMVLITFEGHAWERVLIKTLKNTNPKIKIGAYQFSSITQYQHSIFRKLKKNYNPDIIFVSGKITEKKFKKKFNIYTEIIGSNKFFKIKKSGKKSKQKIFLFLPEAFYSETSYLYDFAIKCAKIYPDIKFIFKCHPMMNKFFQNNKNLKNLSISRKNLKQELSRSDFTIFRGSASIYQAVLNGSIPIYLKNKNEMSINPLHAVLPKKNYVSNPLELIKFLNKKDLNQNKKLINFCKNFFTPLNHQPIVKYFKKIH